MASKPFGGTGQTVRGSKTIGGTDGMHVKGDRHPFGISGTTSGRSTLKFGSSQAAHTNGAAGSVGQFQSANSQMKTKKALNGSGRA